MKKASSYHHGISNAIYSWWTWLMQKFNNFVCFGGFLEHWLNWRNRPHIIHTKHSEPCTVTPKLFFYNFSYHFILGFEPKSVELHQTSTFEGRSTDWAMAPRQLRKIIKHLHFCLGRHIRSHPSCQEGPRFPKVDAARCFAALDDTDSEQVGFFFCSTSLPLTSTRWVRSTIKPCTVHSL